MCCYCLLVSISQICDKCGANGAFALFQLALIVFQDQVPILEIECQYYIIYSIP